MKTIPVIVITGPCGVGKTALAFAVGELLGAREIPHAVIDMDSLRNCSPAPQNDPFHVQLGYRNLAAIWENYRQVGTECLVLADIVETTNAYDNYYQAIPDSTVIVVRLRASKKEIAKRLRGRETEASIDWYLNRSAELFRIMLKAHIGDILVDTDGREVSDIAKEILTEVEALIEQRKRFASEEGYDSDEPSTWYTFPNAALIETAQTLEMMGDYNDLTVKLIPADKVPHTTGPYHAFRLFPAEKTDKRTEWQTVPDTPVISLSDDLVNFLHHTWVWVTTRNSGWNNRIMYGLSLYGPTTIDAVGGEAFAEICEGWVKIFAQAPDAVVLTFGLTGSDEKDAGWENYRFQVARDELLSQLETLADWGRKAATGEYYIFHGGV